MASWREVAARVLAAEHEAPSDASGLPAAIGAGLERLGTLIGVRLQADLLAALDTWINEQAEPRLSRPEAVRRILAERLR